jgi:putative phosphoesterase
MAGAGRSDRKRCHRRLRTPAVLVLADTHGTDDPRLTDHLRERLGAADLVVHAGDFTTETVLERFRAATDRLLAVHGNADDPTVRERLPEARTLDYEGFTVAVTHRRGSATELSLFGRERGADLVVSGHTHRPTVRPGPPTLVNPGSHADPRGHRPGYAALRVADDRLRGELRAPDGGVHEEFVVEPAV